MSKFKEFLSKAGKVVPDLLEVAGTVATGNVGLAIKKTSEILKRESERDAKAKELYHEFLLKEMQFELEVFEAEVSDRKHAREQGEKKTNAHLQKMVAYFSLVGFILFGCANMYLIFLSINKEVKMSEFVISSLSYFQGVFTALLFTLKDFLFGGSVKS